MSDEPTYTKTQVAAMLRAVQNGQAELPKQTSASTEDHFKDFVGINFYKFAKAKDRMAIGKDTWSWMAFLWPVLWTAYYKWWPPVFIITAIIAASNLLTGIPALTLLLGFFVNIICGFRFKKDYIKHVEHKISELKMIESDPHRFQILLRTNGGTSILNIFIAGFLYASICVTAVMIHNAIPFKKLKTQLGHQESSLTKAEEPTPVSQSVQNIPNSVQKQALEILPECDSSEAKKAVENALANSPYTNIHIELIDLQDTFESYYDESRNIRECMGKALLNAGESSLYYKFSLSKSDPSKYFIETKALDWDVSGLQPAKNQKPEDAEKLEGTWIASNNPVTISFTGQYADVQAPALDARCRIISYKPSVVLGYCHENGQSNLSCDPNYQNEQKIAQHAGMDEKAISFVLQSCPALSTIKLEWVANDLKYQDVILQKERAIPQTITRNSPTSNEKMSPSLIESSRPVTPTIKKANSTVKNATDIEVSRKEAPLVYAKHDSTSGSCQLQMIIDGADWPKIRESITFAKTLGKEEIVKWSNEANGHNGKVTVLQANAGDCSDFEITSMMGTEEGRARVRACTEDGIDAYQ